MLFLHHLRVERGLAANTVESYAPSISTHRPGVSARLAGSRRSPRSRRRAILAPPGEARRGGLGARSVARHLSAIKTFHRHLIDEGELEKDPADALRSPKQARKLPIWLSLAEVDALLAAPNVTTPRGLRDRAMLELMYACGLRVSELCSLRQGAVQVDPGLVRVMGKGAKERLVPVGRSALVHLTRYLECSARAPGGPHEPVSVHRRPRRARSGGRPLARPPKLGAQGGNPQTSEPAQAASQLCDPPARARGRPPIGPGHARPRQHRDDADLRTAGIRTRLKEVHRKFHPRGRGSSANRHSKLVNRHVKGRKPPFEARKPPREGR